MEKELINHQRLTTERKDLYHYFENRNLKVGDVRLILQDHLEFIRFNDKEFMKKELSKLQRKN